MAATFERIHPIEVADLRKSKNIMLIDVRTPAEFAELHAEGARSIPLDKLDPKALAVECRDGDCIYIICRSGGRGKQACEKLLAAGLDKVLNVEGGTLAWEQAGLPVVRGRKVMSLERQTRIAIGLLVLIGAALTVFVDIGFVGLSAFMGAGLVFAGITDSCAMAMMLAKMPWNHRGGPTECGVR